MFLMQEILKWLGIEFAWVLWVPWDKASVGKLPFIEDSVPNRQHPRKIQVEHSCLIPPESYDETGSQSWSGLPGTARRPVGSHWLKSRDFSLFAWHCLMHLGSMPYHVLDESHEAYTHTHIKYTKCICICYINKPSTLPVWVIILESNRWNWWVFVGCSCAKDLAALGDETTLRSFMAEVGWNGGMGWVGCLMLGDQRCHQKMPQTTQPKDGHVKGDGWSYRVQGEKKQIRCKWWVWKRNNP